MNIYKNCLQGLRPRRDIRVLNCVPTTWLDPLLTGPGAIKVPAGCPDIEKLLNNIRLRITRALNNGR